MSIIWTIQKRTSTNQPGHPVHEKRGTSSSRLGPGPTRRTHAPGVSSVTVLKPRRANDRESILKEGIGWRGGQIRVGMFAREPCKRAEHL